MTGTAQDRRRPEILAGISLAGWSSGVEAAAIGVPHASGIDLRPIEITATRRTNID